MNMNAGDFHVMWNTVKAVFIIYWKELLHPIKDKLVDSGVEVWKKVDAEGSQYEISLLFLMECGRQVSEEMCSVAQFELKGAVSAEAVLSHFQTSDIAGNNSRLPCHSPIHVHLGPLHTRTGRRYVVSFLLALQTVCMLRRAVRDDDGAGIERCYRLSMLVFQVRLCHRVTPVNEYAQ